MKDHITQLLLVIIATFLGTLVFRPRAIGERRAAGGRTRAEGRARGTPECS
jgi:hypothetical protein